MSSERTQDVTDAYAAEDEDALDQFDCSMDVNNECALRGTDYCDLECPFSGELR